MGLVYGTRARDAIYVSIYYPALAKRLAGTVSKLSTRWSTWLRFAQSKTTDHYWLLFGSIIMAMASLSLKVLHEITACIYKQGDEKPAMKWSFLHKVVTESLASLMKELKACEVDERTKELGIQKFKMKLLYKRMIAE